MCRIAGFKFDAYGTAVYFGTCVDALMADGYDVAAGIGYHVAHTRQLAGLIGKVYGECVVAAAFRQAAGDNTAKRIHINIAAAHNAHHFLSFYRHLIVHHRSNGDCTRTFRNNFLLLDKCEYCGRDFIVAHGHNFVDVSVAHLECVHTWLLHSDAVGNSTYLAEPCYVAFLQRCSHGRRTGRLHAIDFDFRTQCLDGKSYAANKATAAYRHYHGFHIRHLLKHFKTDCALPRYHLRIVERMHKRVAMLFLQFDSTGVRVVIYSWHKTHFGAIAARGFHF